MTIPLDEFEQIIDEQILKRGLSYFTDGAIIDFSEITRGEYKAVVAGNEDYTVNLKIASNIITKFSCNCPYDLGTICKHIVAAIFYLQQHQLKLGQALPTSIRNNKKKSISKQVKELLSSISHQELIDFVEENSKNNQAFRNLFLANFGYLRTDQSQEFYQKQIHSILQTAAGNYGWIDWSGMINVVTASQPFLDHAEKYLANNNFENVFFISTALLEEMTEAFQYGDDSNGDLGYFIESAMSLLLQLTQEKLPPDLKKTMYEYCISSFNQKIFEGWDWHLEILHIASELVETESDNDIIISCLDTINGEYEQNRAQAFELDLLRKFKSEKEIQKYIDTHISNSLIRSQAIETAFAVEDFKRAKELTKDGIIYDEKDKLGLAEEWYDWLLKIALAENDTIQIIEHARFNLINSSREKQNYYQILKDQITIENWHPFLEELIKEVTPKKRWHYSELIRNIYIREEWWDRLFLMLKQDLSLNNIKDNEKYLAKDYSPELINFYSERVINYIEKNVGRSFYKSACQYLQRMKKLGGDVQVNTLIELLRKKYPQRKALLDELSRL